MTHLRANNGMKFRVTTEYGPSIFSRWATRISNAKDEIELVMIASQLHIKSDEFIPATVIRKLDKMIERKKATLFRSPFGAR